jgi:hypothetical protein
LSCVRVERDPLGQRDRAEEGTIRDDVGAGAVMMVLQGICTACDQLGSRDDANGAVTLVLDGLRRRAS